MSPEQNIETRTLHEYRIFVFVRRAKYVAPGQTKDFKIGIHSFPA